MTKTIDLATLISDTLDREMAAISRRLNAEMYSTPEPGTYQIDVGSVWLGRHLETMGERVQVMSRNHADDTVSFNEIGHWGVGDRQVLRPGEFMEWYEREISRPESDDPGRDVLGLDPATDGVLSDYGLTEEDLKEDEELYLHCDTNTWSLPHVPYTSVNVISNGAGEWVVVPDCTHEWVDTGMKKTWCKLCNEDHTHD